MQFSHNIFELVEVSGVCVTCGLPLSPTSVLSDQVTETGRWCKLPVHPECYRPLQPMPIHCPRQVPREVEDMICAWNKQFQLEDYVEKYHIAETPAIPLNSNWAGHLRRCWLEVLKYLRPEEVAVSLSSVSREIYLYTWDTELWTAHDLLSTDVGSRRVTYILAQLQRCVSCGENRLCRLIRCPLMGKPICIVCRENPALRGNQKYALRPVSHLLRKYGVNRAVLDVMHVPVTYDQQRQARAYDYMVAEAAQRYTASRHGHCMTTRKKTRRAH